MSKKDKALAKIRQNPKHVRFEELESILLRIGFKKRQDGTSHSIFTFGKHVLIIPKRKPFVKRVYVELFLQMLDEIKEFNESEKKSE